MTTSFFDKWVVKSGDITPEAKDTVTFTMPEKAVKIAAVYTDKDPSAVPPTTDGGENGAKDNGTVITVVVIAALAAAGIAVGAAVMLKRKKK